MAFSRGLGYGQRVKRLVSRISQCGIAVLTLRHKRAKKLPSAGEVSSNCIIFYANIFTHVESGGSVCGPDIAEYLRVGIFADVSRFSFCSGPIHN